MSRNEAIKEYNYAVDYNKVHTLEDVISILSVLNFKFGRHVKGIRNIEEFLVDFEEEYVIDYNKVHTLEDVISILSVLEFKFTEDSADSIRSLVVPLD